MSLAILAAGGVGFFTGLSLGDILGLGALMDQVFAKAKLPIAVAGSTIAALLYLAAMPALIFKYVEAKNFEWIKYGLMGISIGVGLSLLGVF